jgi:hypothetical protein
MKLTEEEDHPALVYKTKVWISCQVAELLAVLDFGFIKKDSQMLSIAKGLGSNHLMWSKNLIVVNGKFLSMIVSTTCNAWGVLWNSGCQACKGGLEIIETRRWRNHWRSPRCCVFHDHVDIGNESHICSDLWISTVMLIPKFEENLLHFFQAIDKKSIQVFLCSKFSLIRVIFCSRHWELDKAWDWSCKSEVLYWEECWQRCISLLQSLMPSLRYASN